MRWFWIDRFVEFESGRRAVAVKNVALDQECVDEYVPGYPVFPHALVIEGIAQTGGLLAGQYYQFDARVVLAKITYARFHCYSVPGDTMRYTAVIEDINPAATAIKATSHIGDRLHAEVQMLFAHLDDRTRSGEMFEPADFLRMLRLFAMFDVGRNPDGTPIAIPPRLLEAERIEAAAW